MGHRQANLQGCKLSSRSVSASHAKEDLQELEKDVDVKELKRRFEMLKNGGASTQEPDSDEGEDMDDDYYDEAEDGDLEDYDDGEGDEDVDEDGAEEDVPVVKDEDEA